MASSNGNIFHVTGLLCGHSPITCEFPAQMASDPELWCFCLSSPEATIEQTMEMLVFETPSCSLWRHCNVQWICEILCLWFILASTGHHRMSLKFCQWLVCRGLFHYFTSSKKEEITWFRTYVIRLSFRIHDVLLHQNSYNDVIIPVSGITLFYFCLSNHYKYELANSFIGRYIFSCKEKCLFFLGNMKIYFLFNLFLTLHSRFCCSM